MPAIQWRAMGEHWAEGTMTLLAVVVLAIYVLYLVRRAGFGRGRGPSASKFKGPLETLARLPLDGRRSIYVVRVVDEILIVGASEAGLCKLGELAPDCLETPRKTAEAPRFTDALLAAVGRSTGNTTNRSDGS